jgi:tetratricopeptide (TPR) repeat protein
MGDKTGEAWSYLYLGNAYSLMGQLEDAKRAFEQATNLRTELGQLSLAIEPIAGLIQVALSMNDIPLASRLLEQIMIHLAEGGTLEGTEDPLRVYLACYNVLERIKDERSVQILNKAMQLLETEISQISDEQSRRRYINNVPWRRTIEQLWLTRKATF